MKKALLLAVAGMFCLTACSDDDNNNNNQQGDACLTCSLTVNGTTDSDEICNEDGEALDDGNPTGVDYDDYIALRRDAGYTCQ